MRSRPAFGQVITGDEAVLLGGEHHRRHHLAMNACCMGDHNAVDVAQEAHIRVLETGGALERQRLITYRRPLSCSKLLQGIYIDDSIVAAIVPTERALASRRTSQQV